MMLQRIPKLYRKVLLVLYSGTTVHISSQHEIYNPSNKPAHSVCALPNFTKRTSQPETAPLFQVHMKWLSHCAVIVKPVLLVQQGFFLSKTYENAPLAFLDSESEAGDRWL